MVDSVMASRVDRRWWTTRQLYVLVTRHRQLTWEMARREVSDRYAGHVLGVLWSFAHPLILMGVYLFIFGFVFRVRIGGTTDLPLDYTVYVLSGLIPWMAVSEALNRAPTAVLSSTSLVKQVVFPIEVLPAKTVLPTLLPQVVQVAILMAYVLFKYHTLPMTFLLVPILIVVQTVGLLGIAYALAAVSVYFRDLKDIVQVMTVIGAYLMPVFYLPAMVPVLFRPLLFLNPCSYLVWCFQDACYFGGFMHPWAWPAFVGGSVVSLYVGSRVFAVLKPHFGSVL
jgi:lipopolysaccharide transport system permease protein